MVAQLTAKKILAMQETESGSLNLVIRQLNLDLQESH